MKRPILATLTVASLTAVSLTGVSATGAQAASPAATTVAMAALSSATTTADVSQLRQEFNDYIAGLDLDADTRAAAEAAGASDDALVAAAAKSLAQVKAALTDAGVDNEWTSGAINPGDYECSTTDFREWARGQIAQIDPASWNWYNNGFLGLSPDLLVQYWTLMKTPTNPHDTALGPNGANTNELARTFVNLQRFWDIDSSNVGLVSLDGKVLGPDAAADRQFVYNGLGKVSALAAIFLQIGVEGGLRDGRLNGFPGGVDNPMFSVNAFAIDPAHAGDSKEMLETLGITRRVAMGQGILQMWNELGLGRVGGRAVLAHEFGHQVQYSDNLFETDITDEAEATRRTELMADAFATYFTVHKRGESLNKAYTLQDLQTFYNVGDCSFSNPGHHGTPNQRYRSSDWAVDLVKGADDQGHILPSMTVADAFEKVLPEIVAPDAH
ncbi:hypothetical protein GA0074695_2654 [Micromonospora viridifaciens]|uniref:Uncharacterized protein n=1 Tax=Micromonospora viridifaciens TaxID=1881 RepID=A0A1C4WPJ8_MICVI|nr:hypothetical protein [Micromonospora viridifaciens]SCE98206.1 hypothetical protein GA0074695_2654 [Micromonospora viridifaciens]